MKEPEIIQLPLNILSLLVVAVVVLAVVETLVVAVVPEV
tara:strand:- start:569 stop:685 length:117 start_codon:yes stop_codon:yes gene_type:complete